MIFLFKLLNVLGCLASVVMLGGLISVALNAGRETVVTVARYTLPALFAIQVVSFTSQALQRDSLAVLSGIVSAWIVVGWFFVRYMDQVRRNSA